MKKISSFSNILIHIEDENGLFSTEESNVNDLLMNELNQFSGWECWAGIQNITIDGSGNVWRAICRQGEELGNIYDGFNIPETTVICGKDFCNCAADIQLSKAKPERMGLLRVNKGE